MVYYDNEAATLFVFPERKLAATVWKGFANSEHLHEVLHQVLRLVQEHPVEYWFHDNRQMKVVRPADQEYISGPWLQQFTRLSKLRKSATLESEDIFNKVSVENIMREATRRIPFATRAFATFAQAVAWLGVALKEEELHELHRD